MNTKAELNERFEEIKGELQLALNSAGYQAKGKIAFALDKLDEIEDALTSLPATVDRDAIIEECAKGCEETPVVTLPGYYSYDDGQRTLDNAAEAIRSLKTATTVSQQEKEYAWECNECGSQEYTMCVSEADVNRLGCGNCGSDEWHKAEARK